MSTAKIRQERSVRCNSTAGAISATYTQSRDLVCDAMLMPLAIGDSGGYAGIGAPARRKDALRGAFVSKLFS